MKKILSIILLLVIVLYPVKKSYAVSGEIIFRDAMYGGVIGFLGGAALYAIDQKAFGKKIGTGVLAGLVLGTAFGIYEATTYLANEDNSFFAKVIKRLKFDFLNGEDRELYIFAKVGIIEKRF